MFNSLSRKCFCGVLIVLILSLAGPVYSQRITSAEFFLGMGNTELIHTGARFKIAEQTKLGILVGTWPRYSGTPMRLEAEAQFHIMGEYRNLEFKKWYLRGGWMYGENPRNDYILQYTGPFLGLGREWIGDSNLGFQLDGGLYVLPVGVKKYEYFNSRQPVSMMAGIRFQLFYRTSSYSKNQRKH